MAQVSVMSRRPRARRGNGAALRPEILRAAEDLLDRTHDPVAVSVRAIAGHVGCTPPALYMHFPDKDALLAAVLDRKLDDLGRRGDTASGMRDPVESLAAVARTFVCGVLDDPGLLPLARMLARAPSGPPYARLVEAAERCCAAGAIDADAGEAAAVLWAAILGLAWSLGGVDEAARDEAITLALDVQIEGLLSV